MVTISSETSERGVGGLLAGRGAIVTGGGSDLPFGLVQLTNPRIDLPAWLQDTRS
jgi:hypothetical protein